MCGIAGYLGTRQLAASSLRECLGTMQQRGPDAQNNRVWQVSGEKQLHLLHTRLSIIDLDERANQPFSVGSKHMVFNGELYNYIELKQECEAAGYVFKTESDTEVLLAALHYFGWDVLDRCEGMWAFAVYDEADGSVSLCRDRFGEKPLYVYQNIQGIYFGSEVKALHALLGHKLEINEQQIFRFLVNGYKSLYKKEETFFKGLKQLEPASIMRIDRDSTITVRNYWQLNYDPALDMSFEEAVSGSRERLMRAMEIRLRADVPLAFCMSGGIDSNALIAIAKKEFDYDVHGFTITNTDARYEEQEMVEAGVADYGIKHTEVPVDTSHFLAQLRELVGYHDAPVYTITYYAHWLLMQKVAASGYKISVSGTAADELFSGYYDHHLAYLYEIREEEALHAQSVAAWKQNIGPIVRNPLLQDPDAFIKNPQQREHIFLGSDNFAKFLTQKWSEPFDETRYTPALLRNRMLNELFHEAVPVILHEDDHNAMYYSIENRSPYLDRALAEFAYTMPSRLLIQQGRAKAVLREAVRGIVPDLILDNPRKVGFNAPIFDFLDVKSPEIRDAVLADSPIFQYIQRDKIEALLNKPSLPNSESKVLFYFLSCKFFVEQNT